MGCVELWGVHTAQRQIPIQIPIGACIYLGLGVCVCVCLGVGVGVGMSAPLLAPKSLLSFSYIYYEWTLEMNMMSV